MGTMQYRSSERRIGVARAVHMESEPALGAADDLVAAAVHALGDMGNIVADNCFVNPDTLTHEVITAYALALIRLRECASAAGFERLMNACDALAVTVSRLIEDRSCACREKCEALRRFVVHAQAMLQMSIGSARRCVLPIPDMHGASDRGGMEQNARLIAETPL